MQTKTHAAICCKWNSSIQTQQCCKHRYARLLRKVIESKEQGGTGGRGKHTKSKSRTTFEVVDIADDETDEAELAGQ
eukprot:scaffold32782_cov16-Tisochrysis_lutea.AAC.3